MRVWPRGAIHEAMAQDTDPVGFCLFQQVVKNSCHISHSVTVHYGRPFIPVRRSELLTVNFCRISLEGPIEYLACLLLCPDVFLTEAK